MSSGAFADAPSEQRRADVVACVASGSEMDARESHVGGRHNRGVHPMSDWKMRMSENLTRLRGCVRGSMKGCSEAEIAALGAAWGGTVPAAYAEFLRVAGKGAGDFLTGSDFDYDFVRRRAAQCARGLAEELGEPPLPANAAVFFGHQDYQFFWFPLGEEPDPPVFRFMDGHEVHSQSAASFSAWLSDVTNQHVQETARS